MNFVWPVHSGIETNKVMPCARTSVRPQHILILQDLRTDRTYHQVISLREHKDEQIIRAPLAGHESHNQRGPHVLSDLEAFSESRNPADDSFVVLAFQLATLTKCLNEVFLSY